MGVHIKPEQEAITIRNHYPEHNLTDLEIGFIVSAIFCGTIYTDEVDEYGCPEHEDGCPYDIFGDSTCYGAVLTKENVEDMRSYIQEFLEACKNDGVDTEEVEDQYSLGHKLYGSLSGHGFGLWDGDKELEPFNLSAKGINGFTLEFWPSEAEFDEWTCTVQPD